MIFGGSKVGPGAACRFGRRSGSETSFVGAVSAEKNSRKYFTDEYT